MKDRYYIAAVSMGAEGVERETLKGSVLLQTVRKRPSRSGADTLRYILHALPSSRRQKRTECPF